MLKKLAVLFFFASPLLAQRTVVSGTVKDVNGIAYAGGTIQAVLSLPVGVSGATLNGVQIGGATQRVTLDGTGSFLMQLPDNAVVLPGGTQWTFNVNISPGATPPLGTGPQSCSATLTISGASQSISSSFSACPALSNSAGGIGSVSSLPALCTPGVTAPVNLTVYPFGTFYCDRTNHWAPSSSLGAATPFPVGGGIFYAAAYGVLPINRVRDATTNGTTTIACTVSNDCNFLNATTPFGDVGSIAVVGPTCGNFASATQGTIVSVTDSQHAVLSFAPPACAGNAWFYYGPDSTAPAKTGYADAANACGDYVLPPYSFFMQTGGMNSAPANCNAGGGNARTGVTVEGIDASLSQVVMTPNFNFTGADCTTFTIPATLIGGGSANVCFFANVKAAKHVSFYGMQSGAGGGSATIVGVGANGLNYVLDHVKVLYSASAAAGIVVGGGSTLITASEVDGVGTVASCYFSGSGLVAMDSGFCGDGTGRALRVEGNNVSTHGMTYGQLSQNSGPDIDIASGSWSTYGDQVPLSGDSGNVQTINVGAGATVVLNGTQIDIHTLPAASIALNLQSGSTTILCGVTVNATGAGQFFISAGAGANVYDNCKNKITFTNFLNGGPVNIFGDASITGVNDVAGNHVLNANWGTANVNTLSGSTTSVKFTVSVTGGAPAATPTITDTFAVPFFQTPSGGCTLQQIGGTFGVLTNPTPSALSNTGVTWTLTGTPVNGQSYIFARACRNL